MFYKKLSLVTGGFDPIHSGHISYFARAKDFSDFLVVGINTEEWLTKKERTILSVMEGKSRNYSSFKNGGCCHYCT